MKIRTGRRSETLGTRMKRCPVCKQLYLRTTDNFYPHKGRPDGLSAYCRTCHNAYQDDLKAKKRVAKNGSPGHTPGTPRPSATD